MADINLDYYKKLYSGSINKKLNSSIISGLLNKVSDHDKNFIDQGHKIDWINHINTAIVSVFAVTTITLVITVFGMVQNYLSQQSAITQDLVNKISDSSSKMDGLSKKLDNTNTQAIMVPAEGTDDAIAPSK